jgi:divalent metal cation (Fe/Co/Zn/Cd) transporter
LQEEREKIARSETLAIRLSNIANMVLFAAKVYASLRSGSLAIIASTLDSLLDLLSGIILWFTAFSMQTPNPYRYPIGKRRMQPLVSSHSACLFMLLWIDLIFVCSINFLALFLFFNVPSVISQKEVRKLILMQLKV